MYGILVWVELIKSLTIDKTPNSLDSAHLIKAGSIPSERTQNLEAAGEK